MPGSIIFKPLEVNLTQDTTLYGKPEPYCVVSLGDQKIQTQVGEIIENPQEEDYLALQVEDEPTCLVELKDHDNHSLGDNIGTCRVSLDEIESVGKLTKWYPIYDSEEHTAGKILIEATFTPENQSPTNIPSSPEDRLTSPDDLDEDTLESKGIQSNPEDVNNRGEDLMDEQLSPSARGLSSKNHPKQSRYSFEEVEDSSEEEKIDPTGQRRSLEDFRQENSFGRVGKGPVQGKSLDSMFEDDGKFGRKNDNSAFQRGFKEDIAISNKGIPDGQGLSMKWDV